MMWAHDFRGSMPLTLALLLNPHGTSLFPIFPWLAFVLAGCCASCIFLRYAERNAIPQFMRGVAMLGVLMIVCGLLLRGIPYSLPGFQNFYTTSPLYMMIRIGSVLLIAAFLYRLESKRKWIPKPILLAGQESLLIYGVHLKVIFGVLRGRRLGPVLGLSFGYLGCFLISIGLIASMLLLAKYWHVLKKRFPRSVKGGQAIAIIIMIVAFLKG
jgi:fucose 4-O-acetylase-like acetyltransferase